MGPPCFILVLNLTLFGQSAWLSLKEKSSNIMLFKSACNHAALLEKQSKFPRYKMKCRGKPDTTWNIPRYISCYITESRLPLRQCGKVAKISVCAKSFYQTGGWSMMLSPEIRSIFCQLESKINCAFPDICPCWPFLVKEKRDCIRRFFNLPIYFTNNLILAPRE